MALLRWIKDMNGKKIKRKISARQFVIPKPTYGIESILLK